MRRQRPGAVYSPSDVPEIAAKDVLEDAAKSTEIVNLADGVLNQISPF
jgi:hypothetical protein